jgi:thiol-disulfide isomerase/thioredoxin
MKSLRLLAALFAVLLAFVAANRAADPQADQDWQAYENAGRMALPKPAKEMSRLELAQWNEQMAQQRHDAALAFIERHPADPRRWTIVLRLSPASPRFVKEWGPLDDKGVPSKPVIDETAAAAWKARVAELKAAMAKATDLPENTRRLVAEQTEPKPVIYHPEADAAQDIRNGVAEAKRTGKNVLIQIGGQWCIWCMRLHRTIAADPELQRLLSDNYVVVHVNYSPENKNEKTLAELGYPQRFGFPVLVILDGDGKRLHTQDSGYLEDGDFHSKTKLARFFEQWSPKALDPHTYAPKA